MISGRSLAVCPGKRLSDTAFHLGFPVIVIKKSNFLNSLHIAGDYENDYGALVDYNQYDPCVDG